MIVDEARKLVIITPPHTASGNLHRALCAPPWNCRWVIGPGPAGVWDHHVVRVAPGWDDYRRFLVVRDPMTRLVGLWLHYDYARTQDDYVGPRDLDWPAFVEAVARDDAAKLS